MAELISLGLTPSTIILGTLVVFLWGREAFEAFLRRPEHRRATCYFCMGVFVGFVGGVVDNTYWAIPWTASFIGHSAKEWLVNHGVFFNIIFRQLCGTVAAYLHVKSYQMFHRDENVKELLRNAIYISVIFGFIFMIVISVTRQAMIAVHF